jgi:hypothetical protein
VLAASIIIKPSHSYRHIHRRENLNAHLTNLFGEANVRTLADSKPFFLLLSSFLFFHDTETKAWYPTSFRSITIYRPDNGGSKHI